MGLAPLSPDEFADFAAQLISSWLSTRNERDVHAELKQAIGGQDRVNFLGLVASLPSQHNERKAAAFLYALFPHVGGERPELGPEDLENIYGSRPKSRTDKAPSWNLTASILKWLHNSYEAKWGTDRRPALIKSDSSGRYRFVWWVGALPTDNFESDALYIPPHPKPTRSVDLWPGELPMAKYLVEQCGSGATLLSSVFNATSTQNLFHLNLLLSYRWGQYPVRFIICYPDLKEVLRSERAKRANQHHAAYLRLALIQMLTDARTYCATTTHSKLEDLIEFRMWSQFPQPFCGWIMKSPENTLGVESQWSVGLGGIQTYRGWDIEHSSKHLEDLFAQCQREALLDDRYSFADPLPSDDS